jgi:SPP1 family predicted phage head-tail adaptor
MRKRVELLRPDDQSGAKPNAYGEPQTNLAAVLTVWAEIEPLGGRELWQAQQVQSESTHRIRCRWSALFAQVGAKWKVQYKTRTFEILSANNLEERGRQAEFLCKEHVEQ